uniref:diphosphoinositol-polyphosphate diphosphatase n=1 Tax=Pundamilia nyererei TaxID=303518 RepID=A0A3B4FST4_9CICH
MMKLKPNQTRTYDGDGFKKRAACLCFKNEREEEVLLVSSSRHPDQWIVPGGGMEPEEEPCGAAVREVFEEVNKSVKFLFIIIVFLPSSLSPSAGRKREWFTVEEAIKVLQSHKPVHAEYLRRLQLSCSPTNGNSILPSPSSNDNYPHYSATPTTPSTGSVLGSSCR